MPDGSGLLRLLKRPGFPSSKPFLTVDRFLKADFPFPARDLPAVHPASTITRAGQRVKPNEGNIGGLPLPKEAKPLLPNPFKAGPLSGCRTIQ